MTEAQFRARFAWDVNPDTGCWENIRGTGISSSDYYPLMTFRRSEGGPRTHHGLSGPKVRVHKMAFLIWKGEVTPGLEIAHSCDNPRCFNPDHLSLKTHRENVQDMIDRGRQARCYEVKFQDGKHSITRAKLTPENVRQIRSSEEPARVLAARFDVDINTVYRARSGKHWKHLEGNHLPKETPFRRWMRKARTG